jgi:uncharacterized protein YndB with AHSA1/START domain
MSIATEPTQQNHSVSIRATPDAIWEALTKPELTTKYIYGRVIDSVLF